MSGTETRYKLVPLDKSRLVYLGLDITNGKQAVLFVLLDEEILGTLPDDDRFLREIVILLSGGRFFDDNETEIEDLRYRLIPWTTDFDTSLVELIDRLIDMRMKNASIVSRILQLEMAI